MTNNAKPHRPGHDAPHAHVRYMRYIREAKQRFMWVMGVFMLASGGAYVWAAPIYQWLTGPLAHLPNVALVYTTLPEGFAVRMGITFWTALVVTLPIIVWHVWRFIRPGLHAQEKRLSMAALMAAPLLFYGGGYLGYAVVLPRAWHFFQSTALAPNAETAATFYLRAEQYVRLSLKLLAGFGCAAQLPLFLILGGYLGLYTHHGLRAKRRHAIVAALILSAILTPPDVGSQIALALPLLVGYEGSIFALRLMARYSKARGQTHA